MSSWWDTVKSTANSAVAATKQAVHELRSVPSTVSCAGCQAQVPVPAVLWNWRCADPNCAKDNEVKDSTCVSCKKPKPANWPNPNVTCAKCKAVTTVPSSGAGKLFTDAKTVAVNTGSMLKKEFENLKEKPAQFNCEHCSTLLAVPAPVPWSCAQCKAVNQPDSAACSGCGNKRAATAQMVLCGVCQKATSVPGSNFVVKVKAGFFDAQKAVKKLYLDVSGKPYILCPRCQSPLHVDMKQQKAADGKAMQPMGGSAAAAAAAAPAKDGKVEKHEKEGQSSAAPGEEPGAGVEVVCGKCSERLLVALDAQTQPPGATPPAPATAAPSAAATAAAAPAPAANTPAPAPAAAAAAAASSSSASAR